MIRPSHRGSEFIVNQVVDSLQTHGIEIDQILSGVRPNAPRQDLDRLTRELATSDYEVLVAVGGGSIIDAAKAAEVLCVVGGEIDDYFGTNQVTEALSAAGKSLAPIVAIQTASS